MILLWGVASEPPVAMAARAADRLGIEHVVVNQRAAADDDIDYDLSWDGVLRASGREVVLADVTGVYVRIMEPERLPEAKAGPLSRRERGLAFHDMLLTWADHATCRVANRTAAMASNASKPYQVQLIARCGLEVPETLVTNRPTAVGDFEATHGPLVYKSTSAVRSIVQPLDAGAREGLDRIRWLPTQFQERQRGTDVRVHVVGESVLAAEATTDAVDYRYSSRAGETVELAATELPQDVARRCVALAKSLDLPFCGVDLMRRPDGSWVCFEVNPSPGYSWYEEEAGLPISEALVSWLASG